MHLERDLTYESLTLQYIMQIYIQSCSIILITSNKTIHLKHFQQKKLY